MIVRDIDQVVIDTLTAAAALDNAVVGYANDPCDVTFAMMVDAHECYQRAEMLYQIERAAVRGEA
jgi:hypothetical protein